MSESITNRYQRLFEVRLLHHYWLDEGATLFDDIPDAAKKDSRLLAYDIRPILTVVPTAATKKTLTADRCLFRETAIGFLVAAPAGVVLPSDLVYEFAVSPKNAQFYDYTSLTLRPQKIYELFNTADGVLYRYKENVPVLSNLTGVTRVVGPTTNLFLSQEIPAQNPNDPVESLVTSGSKLQQLTSDGPGAKTQDLAAQVSDFPVFVHQADAPVITPPVGLVGAPARGVRLSADVTDDLFALIRLTAVRGDDAAFSFVDGAGAPKVPPPVYQVRFKNRSTFWTYLKKGTGALDSTTANPLPLTVFGNAGTKQKPSHGQVKAQMSGTKVARLISEIYI
jgi:hypothetical protein